MIKIVSRVPEAIRAWMMVYGKYLEAGLIAPNPYELHIMPMAIHPDVAILLGDKSTATIYPWKMPCECVMEEEMNELRAKGRKLVEVGALASDSLAEVMELFKYAYFYARSIGATDIVCEAKASQAKRYQKIFGFEVISSRKECPFVNDSDATALRLRIDDMSINKNYKGIKAFWDKPVDVKGLPRLILNWKVIRDTDAWNYFASGASFCESCDDWDNCCY